jgi:hypothetical protein
LRAPELGCDSIYQRLPRGEAGERPWLLGGMVLAEPTLQTVLGVLLRQAGALRQKRYKVDRRQF